MLAAVVGGGSSPTERKADYLGCIRHRDVLRCAHGAMARWMVRRYTIDKASFPDPCDKTAWNNETPCFPAKHGAKDNLSHEQQANSMRKHLKKLNISMKKLNHAWRLAGSGALDAAGVDHNVIAHMSGCNYDAMYKSFVEFFRPAALMGAAGWGGASTTELSMFFAKRFFIVVPEELEVLVFPFLPELQKRVEALGADAGLSVKASVLLFKYLAVVAIQDAAGGLALQYPQHDVHRLLNESPVFRRLTADHQQRLAAKQFEPYRPQLLANQVRDLKTMIFQSALQQQAGTVPSFLSHARHSNEAGNMTMEEQQRVSHAAFQMPQMADAGRPASEQDLADSQQADAPGASGPLLAGAASQPLPSAAAPSAATSANVARPALAVQAAAPPATLGPARSLLATGAAPSSVPQVTAPGMLADSHVTAAPAASGVAPASVGLLSAAPLLTAPPAMQAPMGGLSHGGFSCTIASDPAMVPAAIGHHSTSGCPPMVYVPGYGLVPTVPASAVRWASSIETGMPTYGGQLAHSEARHVPMQHQVCTVSCGAPSAGVVHPAATMHQPHRIGTGSSVPAAAAATAGPSQPHIVRAFPQLGSFKSLEHLYRVVTKGDPMTGTLSFEAMTRADPEWRKGLSKRYFEVDSAVKEMTERAAAELEATGLPVSPMKYAKLMDAQRAEHGKGKGKGAPTPVATWVKNVLG